MFLFLILLFIIGICIGSFLGVIVDRLGSKESIWKGRSHCDHCRHNLNVLDLIPVFSFFLLKKKCRYCHKKLSWFYPAIELVCGISYLSVGYVILIFAKESFLQMQFIFLFLYYYVLIASLIVIFFSDIRYGIIPFKAVITALIATIIWYFLLPELKFPIYVIQNLGLQISILSIVFSSIGAGGFFLLLFLLTKGRGMGFGDVIYSFLMGFTLGFPRVFLGLYLAFVAGAIVSLLLVAMKKKQLRGGTIPFGPFLVFGTIVSLLWGMMIIRYAFQHFFKLYVESYKVRINNKRYACEESKLFH